MWMGFELYRGIHGPCLLTTDNWCYIPWACMVCIVVSTYCHAFTSGGSQTVLFIEYNIYIYIPNQKPWTFDWSIYGLIGLISLSNPTYKCPKNPKILKSFLQPIVDGWRERHGEVPMLPLKDTVQYSPVDEIIKGDHLIRYAAALLRQQHVTDNVKC